MPLILNVTNGKFLDIASHISYALLSRARKDTNATFIASQPNVAIGEMTNSDYG
jgi:hypothetical protein